MEDDEAMDGFIDDADKEQEQEEVSNLLPGMYGGSRAVVRLLMGAWSSCLFARFASALFAPHSLALSPRSILPPVHAEQYQMARYQNLEYHFKVISQFLIHLIIRGPTYARERKKQYYRASYDAISRKLQGQKDSLVTSSVWKPDFKSSLETYPELVVSHLDEIEYGCDACHLTGRLSRFSGELRGKAYDRETFEVSS